jgi:hypothetical protein
LRSDPFRALTPAAPQPYNSVPKNRPAARKE